ncbi:MAG: enoyl-CoA hydratase-related protein [Syntrophales bacterium]|jgi:enoyl-CoA hydratase|nr:enoyl-CoA hydratase-related protein [Syntrophales bacterium]MDY0045445.1 enoyl-CoA hydratase-related protein [Syntrophales bacterium]
MSYKWIEVVTEDHVATVSLNKKESLNALSFELATEITGIFQELGIRDDVWVIILKSNARIFSAGLDLKDAMSRGLMGNPRNMLDIPVRDKAIFDCCHVIEECKKPVIAAVHGMCVGAGLDIISACDLRLCTEDATFSLREARIGIVADMGVLQRLPFIIGQAFTRQMAFTGRFFSAAEVERMGLVTEVCSDQNTLMVAARKLAMEITESAPLAVQNTKEVLNYSRFASIRDGISLAVHKNMLLLPSQDCKEAMKAFAEKRKPDFQGA